jgi:hypothetical protein
VRTGRFERRHEAGRSGWFERFRRERGSLVGWTFEDLREVEEEARDARAFPVIVVGFWSFLRAVSWRSPEELSGPDGGLKTTTKRVRIR